MNEGITHIVALMKYDNIRSTELRTLALSAAGHCYAAHLTVRLMEQWVNVANSIGFAERKCRNENNTHVESHSAIIQ